MGVNLHRSANQTCSDKADLSERTGNWMDLGVLDSLGQGLWLDNFMVEVDAKKFCLMNHWKGFCC